MLQVSGLNATSGGRTLFADLSLTVNKGEHAVIVGASGSGKSTLLHLLAQSMPPEQRAATILQEGALVDRLSILGNMRLVARYQPGSNTSVTAEALLASLNINESEYHSKVSEISGGQLRRVAIARGLLLEPDVLLFDEPDAGLDPNNLSNLAKVVTHHGETRACLTVSHNPLYIAQIAHRVYRLHNGTLEQIAAWNRLPESQAERIERQLELQKELELSPDGKHSNVTEPQREYQPQLQYQPQPSSWRSQNWVVLLWLKGLWKSIAALVHVPRSWRDELATAGYTFYLACATGLLFFALVGLMLGSTTIAVVRLLADNALTGFISFFIKPDDLLRMMGGVYVLYLAPPIGAMLFAARSGSITANWLGEMVRSRQIQALEYLDVPSSQYLRAPATIAMFMTMATSVVLFTAAVWLGGVLAAQQLFSTVEPTHALALTHAEFSKSNYVNKVLGYSAVVATTIIALGLAPKVTAHDVNTHTTKAIIYSTLLIAALELLIIWSK